MTKCALPAAILVVLAGSAGTASAHHSFAMYDHSHTVTVDGTVEAFQWSNPHGYVTLLSKDPSGAMAHYALESTSVNMMTRVGWNSHILKVGDKIKAEFAPGRQDALTGLLMFVTLPDGKILPTGVPNPTSFGHKQ